MLQDIQQLVSQNFHRFSPSTTMITLCIKEHFLTNSSKILWVSYYWHFSSFGLGIPTCGWLMIGFKYSQVSYVLCDIGYHLGIDAVLIFHYFRSVLPKSVLAFTATGFQAVLITGTIKFPFR
jgi:hypothetical protein